MGVQILGLLTATQAVIALPSILNAPTQHPAMLSVLQRKGELPPRQAVLLQPATAEYRAGNGEQSATIFLSHDAGTACLLLFIRRAVWGKGPILLGAGSIGV